MIYHNARIYSKFLENIALVITETTHHHFRQYNTSNLWIKRGDFTLAGQPMWYLTGALRTPYIFRTASINILRHHSRTTKLGMTTTHHETLMLFGDKLIPQVWSYRLAAGCLSMNQLRQDVRPILPAQSRTSNSARALSTHTFAYESTM